MLFVRRERADAVSDESAHRAKFRRLFRVDIVEATYPTYGEDSDGNPRYLDPIMEFRTAPWDKADRMEIALRLWQLADAFRDGNIAFPDYEWLTPQELESGASQ